MIVSRRLVALATLILTSTASSGAFTQSEPPVAPLPHFDGIVSVLTYNIKGLPWPVASDRASALARISDRLRVMRGEGGAPHIVVLQEAFTAEARQVGREAGYRHVVEGPTVHDMAIVPMTKADRLFVSQAHWWKGETEGKFVGSGLQILSDYPVRRVKRIAYPAFACAGYDCLASKGTLLVTVDMPGASTPIDIVTTHLNSWHASGVSDSRSLYAYRRQLGILAGAIRQWHDRRYPLVVAGDFNVGSAASRREALLGDARTGWGFGRAGDALRQIAADAGPMLTRDARYALARARDWQFFAPGLQAGLLPVAITVPFGRGADGTMLSDHIGYVARFRMSERPGTSSVAATRNSPVTG